MYRKSDNFPLVFMGGTLGLWLLFHAMWSILFEDWLKHQLEHWFGYTAAEMIERFGAVGFPALGAISLAWFLLAYAKRYYRGLAGDDPAVEAQRQHTAAIVAQTEAIRARQPAAESKAELEDGERPLPIPINEASLGAYMWSSPLVKRLDRRIAGVAGLDIEPEEVMAFPMVEEARILGVANLAELDRLLDECQEEVARLSNYSRPSGKFTKGESIWYLFNFLSAQLGKDKYAEFNHLLQWSSGSGSGAFTGFEQITKYSPEKPKHITWWKPAPDFNLMPIMKAYELAQTELRGTPHRQRREQNVPTENMAESYCYTFMNEITIYGRKIEYHPRVAQSPYRRPIPSHGKIVFDGEVPKLIQYTDPTRSDMQRPGWDNLHVLLPDVLDVIEKLKSEK
jgi:hypothetical protein